MNSVQESFKSIFPNKRIIHNGQFTKAFIKFNQSRVRIGAFSDVVYTNKQGNPMVYNKSTDRFVKKSTYYTKSGKLRSKFNNPNYVIDNDTLLEPRVYVNKTFLPQFNKALKANETVNIPVNFLAINDDIRFLLPKLKAQEGKVVYLENNGVYFSLNHTTIKKLRKALQPGVELDSVWESGQEIITSITQNPNPNIVVRNLIGDFVLDGSFFSHTHKLVGPVDDYGKRERVNLDKYGVFHTIDARNYDNNCLCECFKAAGHDITGIKHMVRNQAIPQRLLGAVAKQLDVYITVRRIEDKSNLRHYGDKTKPRLELGLINKHYFLIEKTEYTSYCIKNFFEVRDMERWNEIYKKSAKQTFRGKDRFISSYDVIRLLMERKETHLKEIELCDELYKVIEYTKVDDVFTDLSYNDEVSGWDGCFFVEGGLKKNEYRDPKKFKKDCTETYYFDFETTTRRNDTKDTIHKPYCVYTDLHRDGFFGEDCGKQLLKNIILHHGLSIEALQDLEDHNCNPETKNKDKIPIPFVRMIAHNSGYDFRFILKYLSRVDTIEKGTGLMTATARFYYGDRVVCIEIKDSLKMINMPLAKFSGAFNLDVKKEIMPYDLYTEENVKEVWIDKNICLSFVKSQEQEEYLVNCEKWNCIEDDKINILDYAGEYCYMDCITLKEGYEKFGVLVQQAIKENINDYISLASMAHNYMVREGCYKGVLAMAGVPRAFIQKCVVGGRTMCCENKKSIETTGKKISDFDAVSLYPSAMARMPGLLKGKPKIITDWESCKEYADGYFVCVRVKSIKKTYKFPCVSLMTDTGIRNFTNDLIGEVLYLDKVGMEDFVSYHGAEVEFINGYYYNKGHNDKICEVIQYLFEQRLKFKKQKNPIQMVFKELMNSSYGKSYLKPITSDSHYIPAKEFDKFMDRNYNYIQEAVKLANGKYYKVKVLKPIDQHFNNVHVGVEILSMSKRIMFEVMTLAEDLDISMYYTDTDSIHIDSDKIELLGQEFHKKYGRELIGNQMGQFHTDFDMDGAVGDIHAVESIFLGKKCYIDKLEGEDKSGNKIYDYHIRMKGVPSDCIKYKADQEYNGDIVALYKDLYEGKELTFNLLAVRPKFELCKNMTIISRKSFNRKIRF